MPKHPLFESAIHHFLLAARTLADRQRVLDPSSLVVWQRFVNSLSFFEVPPDRIKVTWAFPKPGGAYTFSTAPLIYYLRGDTVEARRQQKKQHVSQVPDPILIRNSAFFDRQVRLIAKAARVPIHTATLTEERVVKAASEEELSDRWALSVDPDAIDIVKTNTALTSPELRSIHRILGNVRGKNVADIGCGLGEVGVYLATRGARVTLLDISQPMLGVAKKLAQRYSVRVKTVHASIEEDRSLPANHFDIVYVGNLIHHIDIPKALAAISRILRKDGVFVCWEPLGYNPVINVYRRIARRVRSRDERPLTVDDINRFNGYFRKVSLSWYWLTTTVIFIIMALVERRSPNTTRYWKAVISEEKKWAPLYGPLEKLDRLLLAIFPPLRLLCWNVVIVASNKRHTGAR